MNSSLYARGLNWADEVYGQLRGYRRGEIRKQTALAASLTDQEIRLRQLGLFQTRAWESLKRFPAYAQRVESHCGRLPNNPEGIKPQALPVWTRTDQRALFAKLEPPANEHWFLHATGGSSGVPTQFYMTRESYEWRVAVTRRGYSWAQANPGNRVFFIWGEPAKKPGPRKQIKMTLHEWIERRKYFSSFDFSDAQKVKCCQAIEAFRPETIVGYAGKLVELACFVRENPRMLGYRAAQVVTAAEGLFEGQRRLLEEQLGGRVQMSYGSREFMLIGMECACQTGYHLSDDNLYVEVVDDAGQPLPPGQTGRILVTDLHNAANPFIRYEIGDAGTFAPPDEPCQCGRPFRRLLRVDGRIQESVATSDGSLLTALFFPHALKEFPWINGYQVFQELAGQIEIRLVTSAPFSQAQAEAVRQMVQPKLGSSGVITVVRVPQLQQLPNGKTPIVISKLLTTRS